MATHDYIISNASGAAVRADLNNALAAIATNNSSATAPTTTYAYQWWADTGSTPTVMKLRNAANSAWITLFQLDGEWSLIPFENGTAAAPSIYFKDSGTDTGLFSPGVDQVGITTGGAVRLTTSTTAFTGTLPWQGQNGTAAAPALSFSGDPNSGVYNVGADDVGISTNGTLRFDVSTTATTSTLPVVHPLGAVGTPSVTFTGDLNTGIWSPAADTIAVSTNGAERSRVDSSGRLLVGTTTARSNVYAGTTVTTPQNQFEFNANSYNSGVSLINYSNTGFSPTLTMGLSQSGTQGTNTALNSGTDLALINFVGNDGTNFRSGAYIQATADAAFSAGSAPTRLVFSTTASAAVIPTERCRIDSSGRLLVGTASTSANTTALLQGFGGTSTGAAHLRLARGSNTPLSGDNLGLVIFSDSEHTNCAFISADRDGGTWSASSKPSRLVFSVSADGAASPTERCRITSVGAFLVGQTSNSIADPGAILGTSGNFFIRTNGTPAFTNRLTSDGTLVSLQQDSIEEGTISVSGTTVSYNGAHLSRWSQIPSIDPYDKTDRPEILRGTVMSNLDEMCDWINPESGDAQDNEQLNKTKISDVEADKNVAGVFQSWDDDDDTWVNDYYLAMTGDFVIRIAEGVTVERGDLLMSAGDGTAKPQDDDAVRSCTIAKVTSTHVSHTYDDGSYCVPCVLMSC